MKNVIQMIVVLGVLGIISGGILSRLDMWAVPLIKENQRIETESAIKEVQPATVKAEKVTDVKFDLFRLFNEKQEMFGYAMVYEGSGFQGKIRVIFGLTKDSLTITGMKVLEHSETPGIGTIIDDPWYCGQFTGLQTQPEIIWGKDPKPADKNNYIQARTGATISSKSVVKIVNEGIKQLKELKQQRSDI